MQVYLIFPPFWGFPTGIHLALPTLSGYLREQNISVRCIDLNIEVCKHITSKEFLDQLRLKAKKLIDSFNKYGYKNSEYSFEDLYISYILLCNRFIDFSKAASDIKKQPPSVEASLYSNKNILSVLSFIFNSLFPGEYWGLMQPYYSGKRFNEFSTLGNAIKDSRQISSFLTVFLRKLLEHNLDRDNPSIIGISCSSKSQLIPSLMISRICRQVSPFSNVILGGAFVPYITPALMHCTELFDIVDAVVIGEGERPLLFAATNVKSKDEIGLIPNAYMRLKGEIIKTEITKPLHPSEFPLPDYNDFMFNDYYLSEKYLPFSTSRGCYWNKCSFCSINTNYSGYRELDSSIILRQISLLKSRYNCDCFDFVDSAIHPSRLKRIASALISSKINISWLALSRFDKFQDNDVFRFAANAGCKLLSWGMESGSQKVLDLMIKGTDSDCFNKILSESHKAGIWNHVFLIFGFPGENYEDAEKTFSLIEENYEFIDSINEGPFMLEYGSPAFNNLKRYNVELDPHPIDYCDEPYNFHYISSIDAPKDVCKDKLGMFKSRFQYAHFYTGNFDGLDGERIFIILTHCKKKKLREANIRRSKYQKLVNRFLEKRNPCKYSCKGWKISDPFHLPYEDPEKKYVVIFDKSSGSIAVLAKETLDNLKSQEDRRMMLDSFMESNLLSNHGLIQARFIKLVE